MIVQQVMLDIVIFQDFVYMLGKLARLQCLIKLDCVFF